MTRVAHFALIYVVIDLAVKLMKNMAIETCLLFGVCVPPKKSRIEYRGLSREQSYARLFGHMEATALHEEDAMSW